MYVEPNYPTKKALKTAVAAGKEVLVFHPGIGREIRDGEHAVEGPHYPKPHTWYARVRVKDCRVEKVIS
jgi:hypothetical protein